MLRNLNDYLKCKVVASDGEAGHLRDVYFDDQSWTVRYLIVEAGNWLLSRKVLISPISVSQVDLTEHQVLVHQTKERIKHSPDIDTELPVSRQHEIMFNGYYGYPFYWGGSGLWDAADYPTMLMPAYPGQLSAPLDDVTAQAADPRKPEAVHDHHLRSLVEVIRYQVLVRGESIGHVKGMLMDERSWSIRYLVVDTSDWWPSHEIVIEIHRILNVDWETRSIVVNLTQQAIKEAPLYDPTAQYTPDNEVALQRHYREFSLEL